MSYRIDVFNLCMVCLCLKSPTTTHQSAESLLADQLQSFKYLIMWTGLPCPVPVDSGRLTVHSRCQLGNWQHPLRTLSRQLSSGCQHCLKTWRNFSCSSMNMNTVYTMANVKMSVMSCVAQAGSVPCLDPWRMDMRLECSWLWTRPPTDCSCRYFFLLGLLLAY